MSVVSGFWVGVGSSPPPPGRRLALWGMPTAALLFSASDLCIITQPLPTTWTDPWPPSTYSEETSTTWSGYFPQSTFRSDVSTTTTTTTGEVAQTSVSSDANPAAAPDYGLNTGAVIGVAVGAAFTGLLVGCFLIWFLVRKLLRRRQRLEDVDAADSEPGSPTDDGFDEKRERSTAGARAGPEPVYELDSSAMRREMDDTGPQGEMGESGPQGEMEGSHMQPVQIDGAMRWYDPDKLPKWEK